VSRVHATRLGVSLKEVRALLATEHHRHARRRLRALEMILSGATIGRAAKAAKTSKAMIEAWLRVVRKGGCSGLLNAAFGVLSEERMSAHETNALREQIRLALMAGVNWRLGKRLMALDRLLAGEDRERVARDACVWPDTLRSWLATVRDKGLSEMIARKDCRARPRDRNLDARQLRAWARSEANPRVARRLRALAYVADGLGINDAALRAKSSDTALRDWILRFHQGGVEALHDRKLGRLEQREELKAFVRRNAKIGHEKLCRLVQARFGVGVSARYVQQAAKEVAGAS
jgi:transposase